jgi:hypothetical protein
MKPGVRAEIKDDLSLFIVTRIQFLRKHDYGKWRERATWLCGSQCMLQGKMKLLKGNISTSRWKI